MKRRQFITLLGGAAAAWPLAARAQQPERMRRIGVLMSAAANDLEYRVLLGAFHEELHRAGWAEGRNLTIEYRWQALDGESRQRLAKEVVALQPELILAQSTPTAAALLRETSTIPVIFASVGDPVGAGFVASLARPGGNATVEASMGGKWLELLKQIAPGTSRVAILFNPATAPGGGSYYMGPFRSAVESFGLEAITAPVRNPADLAPVIAEQARAPHSALVVMSDAFLLVHRTSVTALAAQHRLPAVYPYRQFVESGGLLSYGNDLRDNYRRAGGYADRILRGEKVSELPVQVPVKFELVINMKTAGALGLTVPDTLLARADEVIE